MDSGKKRTTRRLFLRRDRTRARTRCVLNLKISLSDTFEIIYQLLRNYFFLHKPFWTVAQFPPIYSKVTLFSYPALESGLGDGASERSDLNIATMLSIRKMNSQDIKFGNTE